MCLKVEPRPTSMASEAVLGVLQDRLPSHMPAAQVAQLAPGAQRSHALIQLCAGYQGCPRWFTRSGSKPAKGTLQDPRMRCPGLPCDRSTCSPVSRMEKPTSVSTGLGPSRLQQDLPTSTAPAIGSLEASLNCGVGGRSCDDGVRLSPNVCSRSSL